jgi:HD-like signal output (HDOD) protein
MSKENQPALIKLLDLMDSSPGFSGLGASIKVISSISDADDGGIKEVTEAILRDAALTAKLLRFANSSRNALSGRNVSTIDQAITILGFNTVRSVAMSLALLDTLSNQPQSNQLHAEIVAAFFCGNLASEITRCNAPGMGPQVSQVCGLLQNIGRMMALYHLYEEVEGSRTLQAEENLTEDEAVAKILGVGFEEMGAAIARHWNLPIAIENSLAAKIDRIRPRLPHNLGWNQQCAVFSRFVTNVLFRLPENQERVELDNNLRIFSPALKLKNDETLEWIQKSLEETDALLTGVGFPCNIGQARKLLRRSSERVLDRLSSHDSLTKKDVFDPGKRIPVEVFQQALRVLHDAFGFDRTLLCLALGDKDLVGVAGVGSNALQVAAKFRLRGAKPDIFRLIMNKQADLYVADSAAPAVAEYIPDWYREQVNARAFMLLSLAHEGQPLGLLYGDYSYPPAASPQNLATQENVKKCREQIRLTLLEHTTKQKHIAS